jgi:hypothetical protein
MKKLTLHKGSTLMLLPTLLGVLLLALKICNCVTIQWWVVFTAITLPVLVLAVIFITAIITYGIMYIKHEK